MTTFSAAKFEITNFDIQLIPKVYISGEEMRILHAKKLAHLHVNEKKMKLYSTQLLLYHDRFT